MITPRQLEVLKFIHGYICEHEYSPTYDEICAGLGIKSKSDLHRVLGRLKDRGYIDWQPHMRRCLEVLRMPGDQKDLEAALARIEALEARVSDLESGNFIPVIGAVR